MCGLPTHFRNACENIWGGELKELVEDRSRRGAGPLVVRPDSGDPPTVVCRVLDMLGVCACVCACTWCGVVCVHGLYASFPCR